jgi:signal transduction histidine kinase
VSQAFVAPTQVMAAVPRPVARRWVAAAAGVAAAALVTSGLVLALVPGGASWTALANENVLNNAGEGLVLGVLGAALVWLRPRNAVSWLVLAIGLGNAVTIFGEGWALASYTVALPGRVPAAWLESWVWAPAFVAAGTLLPVLYPTGRPTSRFAAWLVRAALVDVAALSAATACSDDVFRQAISGHRFGHNPISGGHWQALFGGVVVATAVLAAVLFVLIWGHTLRRLWRAQSPEREQLAWLLLAIVPALVASIFLPVWVSLAFNVAPVALLIGIVRYQLFDIKLVLRSGLVYGLLIALAVGVYFGLVALITLVMPSGTIPSLFGAAGAALVLRPLYSWLARTIGRLVYGDRSDPVRALTRLTTGAGQDVELAAMVAAVADSVRSPHVSLRSADGTQLAEAGSADGHPRLDVPLRYGGTDVGTLSLAWRTPVDRLSAADRRLVEALAVPVAAAVHAARLADEVTRSRAQVMAAREQERRRLRNDLHDGVGPSMSGVALGIEAALKASDTPRVREILGVVHGEVVDLVAEVRHLIDDLGPAGLTPGGLVTALRAHAEAVTALAGLPVDVTSSALPQLPVPTEIALYRIAVEAVTNAVRHSRASHVEVRLTAGDQAVRLEVDDDGVGCAAAVDGVGRTSMRERATAMGGTFAVLDSSGGGTLVRVVVPIGEATDG